MYQPAHGRFAVDDPAASFAAGFDRVELLHRVPGRFLAAIYGAMAT